MKNDAAVRTALYETALLVCVLALGTAFLVSFVRGIGRAGHAPPTDATVETFIPANLDDRRGGRVEVLNASNEAGIARDATQRLRDAGFDVVHFGNAPESGVDSSVVYSRTADDAVARAVAQALGIARVVSQPDTTLYVDASVMLGTDWRRAISTRAR